MTSSRDFPRRVVIDQNGFYWRDFGDFLSMCPVTPSNDEPRVALTYYPLSLDVNVKIFRQALNAGGWFLQGAGTTDEALQKLLIDYQWRLVNATRPARQTD